MRMIMKKSWRILECRVVEEAVLVMAMTMMTRRERRTHNAVRKEPGKRRKQRMGTGMGRWKGRGRETVKGKVLSNKPQGEIMSFVPMVCSSRMTMYEGDSDTGGLQEWVYLKPEALPTVPISSDDDPNSTKKWDRENSARKGSELSLQVRV